MAEKFALSPTEAAQALDISRPTIYQLMNREIDRLPNFKVGSRRLIPVSGLRAWIDRQAERSSQNG